MMSRYDQYEAEIKGIADACGSLHEAHQQAEIFAEKIASDLHAFERETEQTTMKERETLRGRVTQLKNRPEKGPFADEFLDKLYDALCLNGGGGDS